MTIPKKRKTLSSTIRTENKSQLVDEVINHVHHNDIITEKNNTVIIEKEKATYYISTNILTELDDSIYKLKKIYPSIRKKINKSNLVELGLEIIIKEIEQGEKSELLNNLLGKDYYNWKTKKI